MKTSYLLLLLLWPGLGLFAQALRSIGGATPLPTATATATVTRAVVVGISDYQSPQIPDLKFADRDARAFAAWLQSPGGGGLSDDQMKVLIDSAATQGKFAMALDWLMEQSTEGDLVIIYFSGHGDVEKKTLTQPGFLLCWDAPARVYMSGGGQTRRKRGVSVLYAG